MFRLLLALAVLASMLFAPNAFAQSNPCASYSARNNCDQGQARAIIQAWVSAQDPARQAYMAGPIFETSPSIATEGRFLGIWTTPAGVYNEAYFRGHSGCSTRPEATEATHGYSFNNVCYQGCAYEGSLNIGASSSQMTFTPTGNFCSDGDDDAGGNTPPPIPDPEEGTPPPLDGDDNGDGQCQAGEACAGPATNEAITQGLEGVRAAIDRFRVEQVTAQNRTTEAIRNADTAARVAAGQQRNATNATTNAVAGTTAAINTQGNAIRQDLAGIRQAIEGQGDGETGDDPTSFEPCSTPDCGAASQGNDPHPSSEGLFVFESDTEYTPDTSGFGFARSCPLADDLTFGEGSFVIELPGDMLCDWLQLLAAAILFAGIAQAVWIIYRF